MSAPNVILSLRVSNASSIRKVRLIASTRNSRRVEQYLSEVEARATARTSLERPVTDLELGTRPTESLAKAGIHTVGDVLAKLANGEAGILSIEGFGRKSLADLKKRLRQFGYELPEAAEEITV